MAKQKTIRLGKGLMLPVDAVTETFAFLAKRGAGKTYCAQLLAEQMLGARAQIVVLDPVGKWWALRLAADGKSKGFDIPIFGGLHGDIPLASGSGSLVADTIVETGTSVVLDVMGFSNKECKRFVADFCEQLFRRRSHDPAATHLFLEEAQMFAPQRCGPDDARMLGSIEKIIKIGRNHGLGATLISQRPQSVNKEVLNLTECLVMMRIIGKHERKAIEGWIDYHDLEADIVRELPKLAAGEAWVSSPTLLDELVHVQFSKKKTFDASQSPRVGAKGSQRKIARLDMAKLEKAMAAVVEETKQNDPKELKAQIRKLERELARKDPANDKKAVAAAYDEGYEDGWDESDAALEAFRRTVLDALDAIPIDALVKTFTTLRDRVGKGDRSKSRVRLKKKRRSKRPEARSVPTPAPPSSAAHSAPNGKLQPAKQKILDALAWFETVRVDRVDRRQLALFAGASPKSSAYGNNLGSLRTAGLIDYPATGSVALTDIGRDQATPMPVPQTTQDLQQTIFARLQPAKVRLLQPLVEAYPDDLGRDELAETAGVSATSSAYGNNLGSLRTLGLLDYPKQGRVRAGEILFLE